MDLLLESLRIPFALDGLNAYVEAAAEKLGISREEISVVKILSKALDASSPDEFYYIVSLVVRIPAGFSTREKFPAYTETTAPSPKNPM